MKTRLLIIIVFGMMTIVGFSILPAYGLSCGVPLFTESYERHDLLLHGKLIEKEIMFPDSMYSKRTTLVFEPITVYKGEIRDTFTVKADLHWDDHYRTGEEYVLFADNDGNNYFRDLCVPDYIASKSIINFLDEYLRNPSDTDTRSLYDVVRGFEQDNIEIKMQTFSNLNRNETRNNIGGSGYIVQSGEYAITWFGALQLLIIISIIGIPAYVIYRRKRK
jgi:hypothetical protein